ncbi:PREDICTED: testis-expressed sequence 9 protein isoform X1 [Cyprinodon variegatus]|uniref:testis-expressed sequence 9 protein isoform X1 n=1 Tax=Cyprinodon variegatus TaxID=28743 RepID=UPI000742789F|nr:PREDICTED: testis-expressed sequence 9 protein isoform X1 [Cyprinodon variegatus]
MAEKNSKKKVIPVLSQRKTCPSSASKAESSKKLGVKQKAKCASNSTTKHTDDLFAKGEHNKLLNAEIEAKTAKKVKEAEQLMKEKNEALSSPLSNVLFLDMEYEDEFRTLKDPPQKDDTAALEDEAGFFLAKTIQSMEEKMKDSIPEDIVDNAENDVESAVSDAQTRVLKAKLRIMQEELDLPSCDYHTKDAENSKLTAKIKELEEERARLQRTVSIQQTQTEKQKALAEELAKKCDDLQLQVAALSKEVETLNRSQKQAAAVHGTVEVRLNRALEEVEMLKSELSKAKQINKDKISEEQSKENLLAENQILKKQKAELVVGFKKQLKLIDILKRQKMHLEAAQMLSFTEEEFMKASDSGKP